MNSTLRTLMPSSLLNRLPVFAAALVIAGCALVPSMDPTRYYMLEGVSSGRIATRSSMVVGIGPVVIPGYLDHKEIVTAGASRDLKLAEYDIWAEPLDKAITRVVAKNVSVLIGSPSVVPFPDADAKYDYRAGIVVRRFEMGPDGKVRLDASYSIEKGSGLDSPGRSRSRSITIPVSQPDDYAAVADAMSRALAELSKSLARDLINSGG